MTPRKVFAKLAAHEELNFLLTNRLPRRAATNFMGWFSKIEAAPVRAASIAAWRFFCDVDMADAAEPRYRSLHHAFTRALVPGARTFDPDPDVVASPCDAIVGACGRVEDGRLHQIKGFPYRLEHLVGDAAAPYADGTYVTLRLTAGMYHRFHAPADLVVEEVEYRSGDTWNVNPIALKRIEALYTRNERAILRVRLADGPERLLLVPVAAILVAGIRLHFLDTERLLRDGGPRRVACAAEVKRGQEMGWFEHGSTIIVFAPPGFALTDGVGEGRRIRAGEALMRRT
ncbi:archaetidylserine decarboxylase [Sphingomonas jatrophae]|uniref:phosphatidylserine decarboxylase n=1 Tax=Sphingomonas jatrophae TaxID=1166337 RepID=A0A1I6JET6_9SPHN|nr:archaetidylserine decarboxylase [Sphingomonas jatrophae]SFR77374.1 phosphatidylserine decarboxylase [Sphingomonas jatrophae]